jgi:6-phosphogluconate dehydrogenase
MSMLQTERDKANLILERPIRLFQGDQKVFIEQLGDALYIGMIIVYSQAMALLSVASVKRGYHLDLEALARIWRGGCIIRSDLLEDIRTAYLADPNLPNLLVDKKLSKRVMTLEGSLRKVVSSAGELGIPAPGLMVSLAYLDAYRSAWSPANLIQAQRDYFGSHTYERSDAAGIFHTQWQSD